MIKYVLIVAGGLGKRMNHTTPKQFIPLAGKPLLMHTMNAFSRYSINLNIILVLPETYFTLWDDLCQQYNFKTKHLLVAGGETRFHSVKNGLNAINENEGIIAIHDGARPLIKIELIKKLLQQAELLRNAIPVITMKESVREISGHSSNPYNRDKLRIIQTPQCFKLSIIKKAYLQDFQNAFTDDATVAEFIGEKINLTDGDIENIKITTPSDLIYAEALLKNLQ